MTMLLGVRHSFAVSELKNPTRRWHGGPSQRSRPDAVSVSLNDFVSIFLAYQAGSAAGVMNPPISPAFPPAKLDASSDLPDHDDAGEQVAIGRSPEPAQDPRIRAIALAKL